MQADFAVAKVTQNTGFVNTAWRVQAQGALDTGKKLGLYQNGAWGNGNWVREFVRRVHAMTGVWPIVYVQASAIWQIPSDVRAKCGLWVAQYASNAATG